jgi:3-oxoadipate enol-lactonase
VVLDSFGITRAHVCGISLGGAIGQWLAIPRTQSGRAPGTGQYGLQDRDPGSLAATDGNRVEPGIAGIADGVMQRFFCDPFRATRPDIVAQFRTQLLATAPQGYIGCSTALRDSDLTPDLGRITAATLAIAGSRDISTPPEQLERLARGIAGARLVILETAYLSNIEQPAAFTEALRRHLEG